MAGAAEVREVGDCASVAFTGAKPPGSESVVGVEVRRQDHSVLRFGQACIDTPIRIGPWEFVHRLGTHANSEIVLRLPPGAKSFHAFAGIDNNADTAKVNAARRKFSVEIGGREVIRTPTLKGRRGAGAGGRGALPGGTRALTLKVDATPDGPDWDQADWADARVMLEGGQIAGLCSGRWAAIEPDLPVLQRAVWPSAGPGNGRRNAATMGLNQPDLQLGALGTDRAVEAAATERRLKSED
jgi:hypothetical protein